jgi:hypothetical protein
LAISDKKIFSTKGGIDETSGSDGILAVLRNRKLSEFHSKPFRGKEKYPEFPYH